MPKVSINIIKDWFKNQSKPPQEQFWAWLDSFWHKDEPIPQSAVDNLKETLQKKADLVDGVVPESQLPFSVVTSEVIALGKVHIVSDQVKLAVHSSGANKVRVKGKMIIRTFPNQWTFTPIVGDGYKVMRGYAVKNSDDFLLVEGEELPDITDPEIPENALELFKFTISAAGIILDESAEAGYKLIAEDNWRNAVISNNSDQFLSLGNNPASAFEITVSPLSTAPRINGIFSKVRKYASPGKPFLLWNNSDKDIKLEPAVTVPVSPYGLAFNFIEGTDYILKARSFVFIRIYGDLVMVVPFGGGSALPVAGGNGLVLESDSTQPDGVKWSGRLTNAESAINTHTGKIAGNTAEIAGKVDKPTADGTWSLQKLGTVFTWVSGVVQNIANTNLTNISARIFTQGNSFTWNTAGFFHYLNGLLDKTGNAAYTKVVVVHPNTGEMVTRDFADPANTTLAIQNASAGQKSTIRNALLGANTPPSPVVTDILPMFLAKDIDNYATISGINLTLLDPTNIFFTDSNGIISYATAFQNTNQFNVEVKWKPNPDIAPGLYEVKINTGGVVQGLSTGKVLVVNTNPLVDILGTDWKYYIYNNLTPNPANVFFSKNLFKVARAPARGIPLSNTDPVTAMSCKTKNIFKGDINSSWEIILDINNVNNNQSGEVAFPFIGFTETSDTDYTGVDSYTPNYSVMLSAISVMLPPSSMGFNNGTYRQLVFKKTGTKLQVIARTTPYGLNTSSNVFELTSAIDTTKNYALFMMMKSTQLNDSMTMLNNITVRIMN